MSWDEYWNSEDDRADADAVPAPEASTPSELVLVACVAADERICAARTVLDALMERRPQSRDAVRWLHHLRSGIRALRLAMHAAPSLNLLQACAGALEPDSREWALAGCRDFQSECLERIAAAERLLVGADQLNNGQPEV